MPSYMAAPRTTQASSTRSTELLVSPPSPPMQVSVGVKHRSVLVPLYELFTAPASQILDRWFESDVLKATLATDAVIGGWL